MINISPTGTIVCVAIGLMLARFLPRKSLSLRVIPLLMVFPAAFFALCKIKAPIPASLDTVLMLTAILTMGVDGVLKVNGCDRGFGTIDANQ